MRLAAHQGAARVAGFRATSIRTRLLGAVSLLAAVALLVAGVGAHSLYQVNQHLRTLIDVTSQRWMVSSEMQRELVSLDRDVQLVVLETDSALIARDSRAIDAGQQEILAHLKQLQRLASAEDTARLTTFSDDFAEYQSLVNQIETSIQQNRRDSARQFALNQGQALFHDANQALNQIGQSANGEMQEDRRRADTSWRETRNLLLLISLGGIGTGVLLASLLISGVLRSLLQVAGRMQEIASGDGDLSQRLPEQGKDEVSDLCRSFNHFLGQIEQIVVQVAASTHRLSATSGTISASMAQQARGAEEQQIQTVAVGQSIREMAASASGVATHAGNATGGAQQAARSAHKGGEVIRHAIEQMRAISVSVDDAAERVRQLSRSSEQISEIIEVIDHIADQTKLLALNAAIEAARAGDHGRGFAVVADAVRSLSETTSNATQDIAQRLKGIHSEALVTVKAMQAGSGYVAQTVQIAEQASVALGEILETADQVGTMVHEIAAAAVQQSATTVQVQSNMDEMDRITRQSAAATRQVAESCGELSQLAHELEGLIERFRLSGNLTATANEEPRRGAARAEWAPVMR